MCETTGVIVSEVGDKDYCSCETGWSMQFADMKGALVKKMSV